jgi:hypothetical protein
MSQKEWYILFLEEYLKELEAEKSSREIADQLTEWLKKHDSDVWTKPQPVNACPKCGLRIEGVIGYVCPQPMCPTGLGGVWCSNG